MFYSLVYTIVLKEHTYIHVISNVPLIEPGQVRNFVGQTFAGGDGANFVHTAEKRTAVEI